MPAAPKQSFFFYDLETSGFDMRTQRIMQFAGQRIDMDLQPVGESFNVLIALSDEVLPDPGAIMVTGITPQQTRADGVNEADFCKMLKEEVCTPGTIMVGYNNIRFDDEFLRFTFYRNFYDAYDWCWMESRSRWDLLDVVRFTRALRPEGIKWPVDKQGKAVNKLEPIAAINGIVHTKAHDALSDVEALIALTRLIRQKQPKLYDYLLKLRDAKEVAKIVDFNNPQPFVYASGRYGSEFHSTTMAYPLTQNPNKSKCALVYDLRYDPTPLLGATSRQLAEVMFSRQEPGAQRVPIKELAFNKCPAVGPAGVIADEAVQKRLGIDMEKIQTHVAILRKNPGFAAAVQEAYNLRPDYESSSDVDGQLYTGFFGEKDKVKMAAVRNAGPSELADFNPDFSDERLGEMLLRYKARNYPISLSEAERSQWEEYKSSRFQRDLPKFMQALDQAAGRPTPHDKRFLLQELQLWAESIAPSDI